MDRHSLWMLAYLVLTSVRVLLAKAIYRSTIFYQSCTETVLTSFCLYDYGLHVVVVG